MILAQTFFGRSEGSKPISAEELFFLCRVVESELVEFWTFLIANLEGVDRSTKGPIHVGGTVPLISYALNLKNQLSHLVPYCGFTLIDIEYCLDHGLVRRVYFRINEYKLLFNNEVVHHFTLPNQKRTSIYNNEKWKYNLEGQVETPNRPTTLPLLNTIHHLSQIGPLRFPPQDQHRGATLTMTQCHAHEIVSLREEVRDLNSQMEVANATHTTKTNFLWSELHSLQHHITAT